MIIVYKYYKFYKKIENIQISLLGFKFIGTGDEHHMSPIRTQDWHIPYTKFWISAFKYILRIFHSILK